MAADGSIVIDTRIDQSGFKSDAQKFEGSVKSRVAKLAAEYRKQGMSASDAFKQAWSKIERDTKIGATKSGQYREKEIGGAAHGASSQIRGIGTSISSSLKGVAVAAAAAFSVREIVNFGKECVELGSNIAEVQNVVDTAFGDMSYKIEQFAESSIKNFGMSKLAAKKTASTYMAMARGMDINEEAASNMAISLTALSGDVASFYNISQELADTKLKSVFTGETETLKDLGVVMTQTNLDAYALANGYGKTTSAMSQAELVALRYAFVTDQLRLASGDFIRTQDSWANQTRILSEQWKEFMSILGQGIIQVLTPFLQVLNQILSTLISIVSAVGEMFGGTVSEANKAAQAVTGITDAQNKLTNAVNKTTKATKKSVAAFDTLNILGSANTSADASGGTVETPAVSFDFDTGDAGKKTDAFVSEVKQAISGLVEYIKKNYQPAIQAWGTAFSKLKEPVQQANASIKTSFDNLKQNTLEPLADYTMGTFVPDIVNSFSTNMAPVFSDILGFSIKEFAKDFEFMCLQIDNFVKDIIKPAMELFRKAFTDVFDSIGKKWSEVGEELLEKLGVFRDTFKKIWNTLYEKIFKPVMDRVFQVLNWLWDDHLKPLWDHIVDFFASLADCIMTVWNNFLGPLVNWIASILGPIITGVINTIIDVVSTIVAVIADVLGGVFRALGGLLDFITGVFSGNWEKAWQGICDFFGGIWDAIWGVIKGVINLIIDGLNALWRAIYGVFAGIANGIGGAVGWIGSLFGQDWEFSMPSNPPLIPKLATGAVIPANREFLAVLGDQKHGRNLEAPEDRIRQIVREESGNARSGETVIRFDGTMGQLIRAMKPYLDEEDRRRGIRLVNNTI